MPKVYSGKDQELSVTVRFAGIRRCPVFRFLPYFSNSSKPKLKIMLSLDDAQKQYKMGEVSIDCPSADIANRPKPWTGQITLGQEFEVTLDDITQSGALDYVLAVPLHYKLLIDNVERITWRSVRIMNTGIIQSPENWFMRVVEVSVGGLLGMGITLLVQWLRK